MDLYFMIEFKSISFLWKNDLNFFEIKILTLQI